MRYDKKIYFVTKGEKTYDPKTGDYVFGESSKVPAYASVSSCDVQTQKLVYGEMKLESLMIHTQDQHREPFNRIEVDGKLYAVDSHTIHRFKEGWVVHRED